MNARNLDKLIMLLSTAWFLPYWFRLKIGIEGEKKDLLQNGCREIVKQILSGATQYWLTSFSDERVSKTHSMLWALLNECRVDNFTVTNVKALIEENESSTVDEATSWLVLTITKQLCEGPLEETSQIDPAIKESFLKVWNQVNQPELPEIDFEPLCLGSKSEWDTFLRRSTADQPTLLADYASVVATKDQFELLWAAINAGLPTRERRELLRWFCTIGKSMTSEPLRLPRGS